MSTLIFTVCVHSQHVASQGGWNELYTRMHIRLGSFLFFLSFNNCQARVVGFSDTEGKYFTSEEEKYKYTRQLQRKTAFCWLVR